MALIRFPEGQQRSGSAGGSVYSHNRFGAYIRARSIPVNPNSARQVAVRNYTKNLAIYWATIFTQAQRDAWDYVADLVDWTNKFGDSVKLTGENWFIRTNAARLQAGLPQQNSPDNNWALAMAEPALAVTYSVAAGQLSVTFDDTATWCSEDDAGQIVSMGLPQSPGRKFFGGPWRFAGTILGDLAVPITSPQLITVPFTAAAGMRVWVRTRISRADGRLSTFAQTDFLSTA